MNKNSKIYIAGHRGLVGSAIVQNLQKKGYNNLIYKTHLELDLTNQIEVEEFFKKEQPEFVFLAAAKVGGIVANNTYRADFIYEKAGVEIAKVGNKKWMRFLKKGSVYLQGLFLFE